MGPPRGVPVISLQNRTRSAPTSQSASPPAAPPRCKVPVQASAIGRSAEDFELAEDGAGRPQRSRHQPAKEDGTYEQRAGPVRATRGPAADVTPAASISDLQRTPGRRRPHFHLDTTMANSNAECSVPLDGWAAVLSWAHDLALSHNHGAGSHQSSAASVAAGTSLRPDWQFRHDADPQRPRYSHRTVCCSLLRQSLLSQNRDASGTSGQVDARAHSP